MADDEQQKIKYLVTDSKGEFVIELPPTWKVTFAPVNPASAGTGMRGEGFCLRVWEKKEVLRAVFCNVHAIRDLSIPLARKVEKQTGSASWTQDSMGGFQRSSKVDVEAEYVIEAGQDMPF